MKPICVKCQRFYRPLKNGVFFIEGMPLEPKAARGTIAPHKWKPYKLWCGDHWKCPTCKHELIVGVPNVAVSEHFKPEFQQECKELNATLQINDC